MLVADKLRLKADLPLLVLNMPDDFAPVFQGFKVKKSLSGKVLFQQAILFAINKAAIVKVYDKMIASLQDDAVCWIAYPKKSSGIPSDLVMNDGWEPVFESAYHFVSSVSINETWTGMRIKKKDPKTEYKRDTPITARKTAGVDYVKRTVSLPEDAINAMKPFKGLAAFFNTMSFSHKREYAEAIAEAKKPETRQRRIDKMIAMLLEIKAVKEKKQKI